MSYMIYKYLSLSILPDISKWNTNTVNNKFSIFRGCPNIIFKKNFKL